MLIVVAVLLAWPPLWRELRAAATAHARGVCRHRRGGLAALAHVLRLDQAVERVRRRELHGGGPLFLAVIEPCIARRPFDARETAGGVGGVAGVALVVGGTPTGMHLGLAVGLLSALLVAIFGSLNKRYVEHGSPLLVTASSSPPARRS